MGGGGVDGRLQCAHMCANDADCVAAFLFPLPNGLPGDGSPVSDAEALLVDEVPLSGHCTLVTTNDFDLDSVAPGKSILILPNEYECADGCQRPQPFQGVLGGNVPTSSRIQIDVGTRRVKKVSATMSMHDYANAGNSIPELYASFGCRGGSLARSTNKNWLSNPALYDWTVSSLIGDAQAWCTMTDPGHRIGCCGSADCDPGPCTVPDGARAGFVHLAAPTNLTAGAPDSKRTSSIHHLRSAMLGIDALFPLNMRQAPVDTGSRLMPGPEAPDFDSITDVDTSWAVLRNAEPPPLSAAISTTDVTSTHDCVMACKNSDACAFAIVDSFLLEPRAARTYGLKLPGEALEQDDRLVQTADECVQAAEQLGLRAGGTVAPTDPGANTPPGCAWLNYNADVDAKRLVFQAPPSTGDSVAACPQLGAQCIVVTGQAQHRAAVDFTQTGGYGPTATGSDRDVRAREGEATNIDGLQCKAWTDVTASFATSQANAPARFVENLGQGCGGSLRHEHGSNETVTATQCLDACVRAQAGQPQSSHGLCTAFEMSGTGAARTCTLVFDAAVRLRPRAARLASSRSSPVARSAPLASPCSCKRCPETCSPSTRCTSGASAAAPPAPTPGCCLDRCACPATTSMAPGRAHSAGTATSRTPGAARCRPWRSRRARARCTDPKPRCSRRPTQRRRTCGASVATSAARARATRSTTPSGARPTCRSA